MGLLKSVENVSGIDYYEYRDNQYYNKYIYRMRARVPGIRYTYWCSKPGDLDVKLEGKSNHFGSIRSNDKQLIIDNLTALKYVISLQKEKKKKGIGIRIESNTLAIFSNDLNLLQDIEKELGNQYKCDFTEVQTSQYAGIKHFVNKPKHKYRVYLRSKRVEDKFHYELRETINRSESLYPSPALKKWIYSDKHLRGVWYFHWTSSAHFIDYDDESTLSYLALMHGEILGKKYKLEKRPDNI